MEIIQVSEKKAMNDEKIPIDFPAFCIGMVLGSLKLGFCTGFDAALTTIIKKE